VYSQDVLGVMMACDTVLAWAGSGTVQTPLKAAETASKK